MSTACLEASKIIIRHRTQSSMCFHENGPTLRSSLAKPAAIVVPEAPSFTQAGGETCGLYQHEGVYANFFRESYH